MLIEKQKALFDEWKAECPDIVTDGVINESAYLDAAIKILYLLKEVNGGESWDLCEYVANGGRKQTWDNITRWTMGIMQHAREIPWSEIEEITVGQRKEVLKSICAVNVKKLSGGHTANVDLVHDAARTDRERIKQQLAIYEPDIIVCCGTSGQYFDDIYQYSPEWKMTSRGIYYVMEGNRIVISYAHPEARVKDCLLYYGIVDAVKEILH